MNKTTLNLGISLLVMAAIAGALFLGGFFDPDSSGEPVVPRVEPERGVEQPVKAREAVPAISPVETSRFTAAHERVNRSSVAGPATGVVANGVVQDRNGAPVAGAVIDLIQDVSVVKARSQDGDTVASVTSGADGRFEFENLWESEVYILRVEHPDFATERVHPIDPATDTTLHRVVVLDTGLGVAGFVHEESGVPIAGAAITVQDLGVSALDPNGAPEKSVVSLDDGSFVIGHLKPGLKRVVVSKEGYATDGLNGLNLAAGEQPKPLDFVLTQGFTLRGQVVDQRTQGPIVGAAVTARLVAMLGGGSNVDPARPDDGEANVALAARRRDVVSRSHLVSTAVTDEAGRFELTGLHNGRYILASQCVGYQLNNGTPADAGGPESRIEMIQSPRISGRVMDAARGTPVTRFSIAASAVPNPPAISVRQKQSFDSPTGEFTYLDARPGSVYIIATADGYAGGRSEAVTVEPNGEVVGVEIRMVEGATIKGTVLTSLGEPIKGAAVRLDQPAAPGTDPNAVLFLKHMSGQIRSSDEKVATTDAQGQFVMGNVLGGRWIAKVTHPGHPEAESEIFGCEDSGEVQIETIRMTQGATLVGVVRLPNGDPDGQATVMLSSDDPKNPFSASITTDANGEFRKAGIPAGRYWVILAQKAGVFDLFAVLQGRSDPNNLVVLEEGQELRIQR